MMLKRLAFILLAFASPGLAETVNVRSGEHDRFTRLVFTLPHERDWQLGRTEAGYGLRISGENIDFAFDTVFDRIPRSRLRNIDVTGSQINLDLLCDCHISAFRWGQNQLVLDINDGAAPNGSLYEQPLDDTVQTTELVDATSEDSGTRSAGLPSFYARLTPEIGTPQPNVVELGDFAQPRQSDGRVTDIEQMVLQSLSRAANQGLVTVDSSAIPSQETEPDTADDDVDAVDLNIPTVTTGVLAHTSIERDQPLGMEFALASQRQSECVPNSYVDVANWGSEDTDFSDALSAARIGISNEAGALSEDNVRLLAKTFVYFGFGSEAKQVLELLDENSVETEWIRVTAELVDGQARDSINWQALLSCQSIVSHWATIAMTSIPDDADIDENALTQWLRSLPESLRGHLGTNLAEKFASAGKDDLAETLLNIAEHGTTVSPTDVSVVAAEVNVQRGNTQEAIEQLTDAALTDTRMPADSMIQLIDISLETNGAVDDSILSLAEILRFEAGDSETAAQLLVAEITANLSMDQFDRVFELFRLGADLLDADELRELKIRSYAAFAARSRDEEFLNVAFSDATNELTASNGNLFANRLIDLGFAEQSERILSGVAVREDARERRYLRAEAAALRGDIERVEILLAGISDQRAQRIRAEVLTRNSRFGDAYAELREVDSDEPIDPDLLWRAGIWNQLSDIDNDVVREAANRHLNTQERNEPEYQSLEDRSVLLADLEETRGFISALLTEFPEIATNE